MSWPGEKQRHSMSSRGVVTTSLSSAGKKVLWKPPRYSITIPDPIYFEKITDYISFESAQQVLKEYPTALIVDATNRSGAHTLNGTDGVLFRSPKYATWWTPDKTRFQRGSVRDHLDKFTKFTGDERVRLSITTGRKAYSSGTLKGVKFQIAIPKKEHVKEMNKLYRGDN